MKKRFWLFLSPATVLALAVLYLIVEHFTDTEDFVSDEGVQTGPEADPADPRTVDHQIVAVPMSGDINVYQDRDLLTLKAFPGFWGGHDGAIDSSPKYIPKTGRFFRKLLKDVL